MRRALPAILLALVAALPYLPVFRYDFVYDDFAFIVANSRLHTASVADFFLDPGTIAGDEPYPGTYRPLRTLTFAADVRLFGGNRGLYHVPNVLLHVLATLLLGALVGGLLGGRVALLASLLFALHPAAIEAVAWVSSRDNGLFLCFFLAALLLHRRAARSIPAGVLAPLAYGLALLSKEMAITLPLLAAIQDRVDPAHAATRPRRVSLHAGYGVVLAAYIALRLTVLPEFGQRTEPWGGSATTSVLSGVIGTGLMLLRAIVPFAPDPFAFDYQLPLASGFLDPRLLASVLALAALVAAGAVSLRRRSVAALFLLWFPITILPVSNVLFPINILVADRFLYLPAIGPLVTLAVLLTALERRASFVGTVVQGAVLVAFLATFVSVRPAWRDAESLWSRAVERFPQNPRALHGLASARRLRGDVEGARDLLERARRAEPTYWPAYREAIGMALLGGDLEAARRLASAWVDTAAARRPAEARSVARECVPIVRALLREGRAAMAVDLGRRLAGAGLGDRDLACLLVAGLEAMGGGETREAREWRRRCESQDG